MITGTHAPGIRSQGVLPELPARRQIRARQRAKAPPADNKTHAGYFFCGGLYSFLP